MKRAALAIIAAAVLITAAGCGYRLAGTKGEAGASNTPVVSEFRDTSREPLFGPRFIRELERKFIERGDLAPNGQKPGIKITLGQLTETPRALNTSGHPAEYLLQAEAHAIITLPGREDIKTSVSATREFASVSGIAEIRATRDRAKELLARDLADRLAGRIADLIRAKPGEGNK